MPVDKFFGIACPSTLNNATVFTSAVRYGGDYAMDKLKETKHLSGGDYFNKIMQKGDISWSNKDDIDDDFDSITFDCSKCIDDKKDLSFDRQSLKITDSQIIINVSSIGYSGDLMKISFKNPVNLESSNKYKIAFILDEKQLNSEIFQLPDLLLMKSHSVYLYP